MIPKLEWVWYGFAGHYICASRCAYHLNTRVGNYLISTVGAFKPDWRDEHYETLGLAPDSYFETMVFPCEIGKDGYPRRAVSEIEVIHCATPREAEQKHYALCQKYAEMQ